MILWHVLVYWPLNVGQARFRELRLVKIIHSDGSNCPIAWGKYYSSVEISVNTKIVYRDSIQSKTGSCLQIYVSSSYYIWYTLLGFIISCTSGMAPGMALLFCLSVCWLVHHSGLDYSVSSTSGWIARKVWSCSPKNKSDVSNSTISKKRLKFAARVALLVLLANFANTKIVNVVNISMFTLILACTLNMPCLAKPLTLTYPQPPI